MPEPHNPNELSVTKRLDFHDVRLMEFDAEIVERRDHEGQPAYVLDRTAFYPESGGQPWDRGTLDGVEVLKVLDLGGLVLHVLREELTTPRVKGRVDWPRRFDHMQQHTGQHVLSQTFWEILQGETLSFHLGPAVSTLDIGLRGISDADVDRVEDRANAVIWEDREVKTYLVPEDRISEVPLRKPPKKDGLVRVVEVDGFDFAACGGTHCRRTGEIGTIRLRTARKIRGNLRFEFLCGGRALRDARGKDRTIRELVALLSCSAEDLSAQVEKRMAEGKAMRTQARRLEERLATLEAREIVRHAQGLIISGILEDKTADEARFLAMNITKAGSFAVAYGTRDKDRRHLIITRSEGLNVDLRRIVPIIETVFPVKGGGGPSLVELVTSSKGPLETAVQRARAWLEANVDEPDR